MLISMHALIGKIEIEIVCERENKRLNLSLKLQDVPVHVCSLSPVID